MTRPFELTQSPVTAPSVAATHPDEAVCLRWAQLRLGPRRSPLSIQTQQHYLGIWRHWLRFLASKDTTWRCALPRDVVDFLSTSVASATQKRKDPNQRRQDPSDVTKRRYWRVLDGVYQHALLNEDVAANPASQAQARSEVPRTEAVPSVVLQPVHLERLRNALDDHEFNHADRPRHLNKAAGGANWKALRDRALIGVLMDAGLSSVELLALRPSQVFTSGQRILLRMDGRRKSQRRDIELGRRATVQLREWLKVHAQVQPRAPDFVFFSQKGHGLMTKVSLFVIVRDFLRAHAEQLGLAGLHHQGPNLLRSSVIREALHRGIDEAQIIKKFGLATPAALRRIPVSSP